MRQQLTVRQQLAIAAARGRWVNLTAALLLVGSVAAADEVELTRNGKLSLPELSGLTRGRQAGVFWTVADSGNPRNLHAISTNARLLASFQLVGINLDWESIAADGDGNLYIADCGNNLRILSKRWIYVVREPTIATDDSPSTAALPDLKPTRRIEFSFPDRPVDIEATFVFANRLFLVEKTPGVEARVYALSLAANEPRQTLRVVSKLVGVRSVTGAAITPLNKLLVCGAGELAAFDVAADGQSLRLNRRSQPHVRYSYSGIESCAATDSDILLLSEDGSLFSFPMATTR